MENCSELFKFHFHEGRQCNVVFSSKIYETNVNAFIKDKVLGGISFHPMVENWKHLKDTVAFSSFLVC